MKKLIPALAAILFATQAPAEELVFGSGFVTFPRTGAETTAILDAEYHFAPFHHAGKINVGVSTLVSMDGASNVYFGVGLVSKRPFNDLWFAEFSSMIGTYFHDEPAYDLGSKMEFRHILALGRNLSKDHAVSLGWAHTSNGSTGRSNPGKNAFLLRWHTRY